MCDVLGFVLYVEGLGMLCYVVCWAKGWDGTA